MATSNVSPSPREADAAQGGRSQISCSDVDGVDGGKDQISRRALLESQRTSQQQVHHARSLQSVLSVSESLCD